MEREHVSGMLPVVKTRKGKFTAKDIRDLLRHVGHDHVPADLDQRALRRDINYAVNLCEYCERREPAKGVEQKLAFGSKLDPRLLEWRSTACL